MGARWRGLLSEPHGVGGAFNWVNITLRARTLPRLYAFLAVFVLTATALVACGSENLWSFDTRSPVVELDITPDGSRIAVGTWSRGEGNVYMLDASGDLLWSFHGDDPIRTLAITPDGSRVVTGTQGGKAYLLNGQGNLLWSFEDDTIGGGVYDAAINEVAMSADGSRVAVASESGKPESRSSHCSKTGRATEGDALFGRRYHVPINQMADLCE